jgi:hypothetical protein
MKVRRVFANPFSTLTTTKVSMIDGSLFDKLVGFCTLALRGNNEPMHPRNTLLDTLGAATSLLGVYRYVLPWPEEREYLISLSLYFQVISASCLQSLDAPRKAKRYHQFLHSMQNLGIHVLGHP